jgi:myo-inositol 2-dehydrogenase/D-chiro-inositol 1-dehydrogenase
VRLQIGFHRRFDPDYAAAARRIQAGELGDVYLLRSTFRDMRPPALEFLRDSGGLMLDMMIHDLDMARWMVGEVEEVSSFGATLSDPRIAEIGDVDHAIIVMRFASGALGLLDGSRAAGYGYECSTEIVGSRATARIAYDRQVNVEWLTPGAMTVDYVADFVERFPRAYVRELEDFAHAVRSDRPVSVDGRDGLAALVLALAADRSLREGRTVPVREKTAPAAE